MALAHNAHSWLYPWAKINIYICFRITVHWYQIRINWIGTKTVVTKEVMRVTTVLDGTTRDKRTQTVMASVTSVTLIWTMMVTPYTLSLTKITCSSIPSSLTTLCRPVFLMFIIFPRYCKRGGQLSPCPQPGSRGHGRWLHRWRVWQLSSCP